MVETNTLPWWGVMHINNIFRKRLSKDKRPLKALPFPARKIISISTEITQKHSKLYFFSLESLESFTFWTGTQKETILGRGGSNGYTAQTCTSQICRFFLPSFGRRMACAFSLEKSKSLYLVIGPMWQKFIYLSMPQYSKTDQPIPLFGPRCSKIKERVEGWEKLQKVLFKCTTVRIKFFENCNFAWLLKNYSAIL